MESLSMREFFRRKMSRTLDYPSLEDMKIFDELPSRKSRGLGTYRNIENFEKIYDKYIKGKAYIPADHFATTIGFLINRDGEIDMVRVKYEAVEKWME